jgi:antitoxin ParD1/3/4
MFIDNKPTECHIPPMAQMNISVPEKLKAWVESRVSAGSYSSSSDYVRDLVRRDQRHMAEQEQLRAEVQAGFAAPLSDLDPLDQIEALRNGIKARVSSRDAA